MGLWARLFGGGRQKSSPEEWFTEFGSWRASATGIAVTQLTAMQQATVMACVSLLAEDVAKLPIHVYRPKSGGGHDIVEDHPLERLLQKPNGWQNRFEFIEQMHAAFLLRSNAYAAIIRDGRGVPKQLVPINPDQVFLYEAPSGELFYNVARSSQHQVWSLQSLPLMIPSEDVLHLRWLSFNSLTGISRITMGREAIALALAQEQQAAQLFGNGAKPAGVLQTDQKLSKEVVERLRSNWQEKHGGIANSGKTAVLEEGLKFQQITLSQADAQALESRKLQAEEIARLFRVPHHKIGLIGARETSATVAQADQDYANNILSNHVGRWEAKLADVFDLAKDGLTVEFDINHFLRADITARYNAYRVGIVGMFLTPNEVRRAEGLPDIEGGDTLYQPTNVAPIGFTPAAPGNAGPGSDTTGAPAAGGDGDPAAVPAVDTPPPG